MLLPFVYTRKKEMKKFWGIVFFLCLAVSVSVSGETVPDKKQNNQYLTATSAYVMSHVSQPVYGSVGGEWLVMGLARSGKLRAEYGIRYQEQLKQTVIQCKGRLSERKYTEYARVVIALTAMGENPENFHGYNLLKPLAELEQVKRQGPNGVIYTLIALDCGNYANPVPEDSYQGEVTTREKLVEIIVKGALEDGGWTFSGKKADADMTAMVIQALAPYYKKNQKVKKAVNHGLSALSKLQLEDGSFATGPYKTCESTAQVLTALSELRISLRDPRFVKKGKTVFDGLLQYYKNGGFLHQSGGEINEMATEQALYALVAYQRCLEGKNRLYQMSDATKVVMPKDSSSKEETKQYKEVSTLLQETSTKAFMEKKEEPFVEAKGSGEQTTEETKEITKKQKTNEQKTTGVTASVNEVVTMEETAIEEKTEEQKKYNGEKKENSSENTLWFLGIGSFVILGGGIGTYWKFFKKDNVSKE